MTDINIAAKANSSLILLAEPSAQSVTAVNVNGVPAAFTVEPGSIRLATPLTADATVTLTYDPSNPRAGALEHRLLAITNRLAALEA
jgi:hypothetical protein